jgi:hypothetical protein
MRLTFKSLIVTLQIPVGRLLDLDNGDAALDAYQKGQNSPESDDEASDSDNFAITRRQLNHPDFNRRL